MRMKRLLAVLVLVLAIAPAANAKGCGSCYTKSEKQANQRYGVEHFWISQRR